MWQHALMVDRKKHAALLLAMWQAVHKGLCGVRQIMCWLQDDHMWQGLHVGQLLHAWTTLHAFWALHALTSSAMSVSTILDMRP